MIRDDGFSQVEEMKFIQQKFSTARKKVNCTCFSLNFFLIEQMANCESLDSMEYTDSNHVPDDVVFSIFSKLPLKSVNRFTCLGKSWSTLFENPYFINMFYKKFLKKKNMFYKILFPNIIHCIMKHVSF